MTTEFLRPTQETNNESPYILKAQQAIADAPHFIDRELERSKREAEGHSNWNDWFKTFQNALTLVSVPIDFAMIKGDIDSQRGNEILKRLRELSDAAEHKRQIGGNATNPLGQPDVALLKDEYLEALHHVLD